MAMSTAIAFGGMVEAARRVGVSFPTEAHPLHENEGVELWTQSSARWTCSCSRGQWSDACTFNKTLIYAVFLSLVFEHILYQRQCMYSFDIYNYIYKYNIYKYI